MDARYARTMAAYNAEMNRRLYAAAARLTDAERRADRGAFWHSIHGTLAHLLWADRMWMSRFDNWPRPARAIGESDREVDDFETLAKERALADQRIAAWADGLDDPWLDQDLHWFSGATQRDMQKPRRMLVVHFFNHQTHHRGQAHALLTAAGQDTGSTDLMTIV